MNLPIHIVSTRLISLFAWLLFIGSLFVGSTYGTMYILQIYGAIPPAGFITRYASMNPTTTVILVVIGIATSTYLLFRYKPTPASQIHHLSKSDFEIFPEKTQEEDPPFKERVYQQQPQGSEGPTLEELLSSKMNGLNLELEGSFKLKENTVLNMLGKEWEAQAVTVTITKAREPPKIETPPPPVPPPTSEEGPLV